MKIKISESDFLVIWDALHTEATIEAVALALKLARARAHIVAATRLFDVEPLRRKRRTSKKRSCCKSLHRKNRERKMFEYLFVVRECTVAFPHGIVQVFRWMETIGEYQQVDFRKL